ncbi:FERM domain-containing protein 3-like isoform X5 [Pomacea canaliculata]|uniref:FERM domain-containing protein 3-like isoform X5 n=1 Tax=Pomacea canaliculata TaxID=400727 RepID=UPI000D73BC22|nr:FERM domain-containing protein 3-like isoform X5 [Pomacea canaliculata]
MFRKKKNDVQTEYTCSVRFLDDEPMQFTFKKDTIGQWLLDRVCEKLNLMEKDYFGLRYVDAEKQRHWLDPLKTVYKQLKGVNPMVLCFRVKFYAEDPMKLHEEITRYYLFLQLRRDLHHGRLLCAPEDAISLAAYIVQSEVGDYDPQDHQPGYISEFKMLPKQTPKLEERVMELHKSLHGQVPSDAEANFLRKACTLDTYGVDPHQVKDQRGDQLYLGITHQGIMTFRGSRRTQLYKWGQIRRIAYEGKMFIAHVSVNEDEDAGNTKKKQQPVGYKCLTPAGAKYLWRCAVEQQLFFTLSTSNSAPKMRSGGTLFSRGSKFRFSGRCQTEAYEASEHIRRTEPKFQRSSSLPNFARRNTGNSRNSTISHKDVSTLNDSVQDTALHRRPYSVIWASGKIPDSPANMVRGGSSERKSEIRARPNELEPSPVVKAPLAPQEAFDEQQQRQQQQQQQQQQQKQQQQQEQQQGKGGAITGPTTTTPSSAVVAEPIITAVAASASEGLPPRLNGQAVRDAAETGVEDGGDTNASINTTMPYQPDVTTYEDEDDEDEDLNPKQSLEDEIRQLDKYFVQGDLNHISAAVPPEISEETVPVEAAPVTKSVPGQKKKSQGGICLSVVLSMMVSLLLLAVLFYVLYFSGLQHPALTEIKRHIQFLEPVRDFVAQKADETAKFIQSFSK